MAEIVEFPNHKVFPYFGNSKEGKLLCIPKERPWEQQFRRQYMRDFPRSFSAFLNFIYLVQADETGRLGRCSHHFNHNNLYSYHITLVDSSFLTTQDFRIFRWFYLMNIYNFAVVFKKHENDLLERKEELSKYKYGMEKEEIEFASRRHFAKWIESQFLDKQSEGEYRRNIKEAV